MDVNGNYVGKNEDGLKMVGLKMPALLRSIDKCVLATLHFWYLDVYLKASFLLD